MSASMIRIAPNLALPAEDLVEAKIAVVGQSGRGKTGLVRVVLEECHRVGVPFVAFDPAGILWGLKSSFDGKGPGLPIMVIGGEHGDVPLRKDAGAEVARAIVRSNISCVIDVSQDSKATYRAFVRDFAETIFALNNTGRLIVLDEAPELVPQRLRPDQTQTYDAVERLVRQGRNRGLGVMLVTQRAATVAKDVLTQCASLIIFGLVGTPDRKALKEWVEAFGSETQLAEFESGLASLGKRECWFWSPSEFNAFKRIRVADFHTFHPDKTHLRRMGWLDVKPVSADVTATVAQLGEVLNRIREEKADASQVPVLRRKVAELERKLTEHPAGASPIEAGKLAKVEAALAEVKAQLRQSKDDGRANEVELVRYRSWSKALGDYLTSHPAPATVPQVPKVAATQCVEPRQPTTLTPLGLTGTVETRFARFEKPDNGTEGGPRPLYSGEKKMLAELVRVMPEGRSAAQIGTLAGFSVKSSTFRTYIGYLRSAGYTRKEGDAYFATKEGQEVLGTIPEAATTHEELMRLWLPKLYSGEQRILVELVKIHPSTMGADVCAERAGFSVTSSTWRTYIGHLRTLGLVTNDRGTLSASSHLFP